MKEYRVYYKSVFCCDHDSRDEALAHIVSESTRHQLDVQDYEILDGSDFL